VSTGGRDGLHQERKPLVLSDTDRDAPLCHDQKLLSANSEYKLSPKCAALCPQWIPLMVTVKDHDPGMVIGTQPV